MTNADQQTSDSQAETQFTTQDTQEVAARVTSTGSAEPVVAASPRRASASAPASTPVSHTASSPQKHSVPRARRMNLSVTRLDPWSVTKMAFMLSVAGAIIQLVAVTLIWLILDAVGLFQTVSSLVMKLSSSFNFTEVFTLPRVLGAVTILSVFEIVIICVLAAIFAFLYNVSSRLIGGVHVTLGDD